ncbi:MAG: AraC family transcriptional regulator [Clostridiaceae bacterium]
MRNLTFCLITEKEKSLPFYLAGAGVNYNQDHMTRPNGYPDFQWIQCIKGKGELILKNKRYTLSQGMGMFLFPNEAHEYYPADEDFIVSFFSFNGYGVLDLLSNLNIKNSNIFNISNPEIILYKINNIYKLSISSISFKYLNISVLTYELLLDLYKSISNENDFSAASKQDKLGIILTYIDKNYNKDISLEDLAILINVTPEYLCILFKNLLSIRPFEYINKFRINKAKEILAKDKNISINKVASICGFRDTSYFCYIFKKFNGISPGNFKKII